MGRTMMEKTMMGKGYSRESHEEEKNTSTSQVDILLVLW